MNNVGEVSRNCIQSDQESMEAEESLLNFPKNTRTSRSKPTRNLRPNWLIEFQWLKFEKNKAVCKVCNKSVIKKKFNLQRHGNSELHLEKVRNSENGLAGDSDSGLVGVSDNASVPEIAFAEVANEDVEKNVLSECLVSYIESDAESLDVEEILSNFQKQTKSKPNRRLRPDWLDEFKWLKFEKNKAICKVCNKSVAKKKFNIQRHGNSDLHLEKVRASGDVLVGASDNRPVKASENGSVLASDHDPVPEEVCAKTANKDSEKTTLLKCLSFITEHNLPLSLLDHLPGFLKSVCPDSKIAHSFNWGRLKATEVLMEKIETSYTKQRPTKLQKSTTSLL